MCRSPTTSPVWLHYGRAGQHQQRLNVRFHGISARHFHSRGLTICAPSDFGAPPELRAVWHSIDASQGMPQEVASLGSYSEVLLVVCDLTDVRHVQFCSDLVQTISAEDYDDEAAVDQVRLVLSHSQTPANHGPEADKDILSAVSHLLKIGVDNVVLGELAGLNLVKEVRGKIAAARKRASQHSKIVNERREVSHIASINAQTVWQYCRIMLKTRVPDVDLKIKPGEPKEIEGFKVSTFALKGSITSAYKIHKLVNPDDSTPSGQVLKVISKKQITGLTGLVSVDNQIRMMELMRSDAMAHPNLVKLHAVYHSSSHISIRMDDAGSQSLHDRLAKRDHNNWALPLPQVKSIISQAIAALLHMHLKLQVAHRDIKPENFIVSLARSTINIKLADFKTAKFIEDPQHTSRHVVGTFPFMAPEMFLHEATFKVLPADIWSLGVALLEVFCTSELIETKLLDAQVHTEDFDTSKFPEKRAAMKNIRGIFEAPGSVRRVLEAHIHDDLRSNLDAAAPLLASMLQVMVEERFNASQLHEAASVQEAVA